jgi:hypothetical protein
MCDLVSCESMEESQHTFDLSRCATGGKCVLVICDVMSCWMMVKKVS